MKKRIFEVGPDGTVIEFNETEIKTEEEEFLVRVKNYGWFKELLQRLGMSEKEWLDSCVEIGRETIRCCKCKKRFIPDRSGRIGIFISFCDRCFDNWANKLLGGRKKNRASRPKRRGVFLLFIFMVK